MKTSVYFRIKLPNGSVDTATTLDGIIKKFNKIVDVPVNSEYWDYWSKQQDGAKIYRIALIEEEIEVNDEKVIIKK